MQNKDLSERTPNSPGVQKREARAQKQFIRCLQRCFYFKKWMWCSFGWSSSKRAEPECLQSDVILDQERLPALVSGEVNLVWPGLLLRGSTSHERCITSAFLCHSTVPLFPTLGRVRAFEGPCFYRGLGTRSLSELVYCCWAFRPPETLNLRYFQVMSEWLCLRDKLTWMLRFPLRKTFESELVIIARCRCVQLLKICLLNVWLLI